MSSVLLLLLILPNLTSLCAGLQSSASARIGQSSCSVLLQSAEKSSLSLCRDNNTDSPNCWRGLVPLRSTRADVERVLGKAQWSHGSTFIYESEAERVDVLYSKGPCELSGVERWKVPAGVVIKMEVAPATKIPVQDLKLDIKRYLRYQESHPENWVIYRSKEDGIRITALLGEKEEMVLIVSYGPRTNDIALQCPHGNGIKKR